MFYSTLKSFLSNSADFLWSIPPQSDQCLDSHTLRSVAPHDCTSCPRQFTPSGGLESTEDRMGCVSVRFTGRLSWQNELGWYLVHGLPRVLLSVGTPCRGRLHLSPRVLAALKVAQLLYTPQLIVSTVLANQMAHVEGGLKVAL